MNAAKEEMEKMLLVGNEVAPGIWAAEISENLTKGSAGSSLVVQICTHERLYEDACLDCGAVKVLNCFI